MTSKKTTPQSKPNAKKTAKATAAPHVGSHATTNTRMQKQAAAHGADLDQDLAPSRISDPSDVARDQRLRNELVNDGGRSTDDRHRERLTATEAEEDGVREDDDEDPVEAENAAAEK